MAGRGCSAGTLLPIGRGWRVTLVLLLALAFLVWVAIFAGSQIAARPPQLPGTSRRRLARLNG
jgi:putative permease